MSTIGYDHCSQLLEQPDSGTSFRPTGGQLESVSGDQRGHVAEERGRERPGSGQEGRDPLQGQREQDDGEKESGDRRSCAAMRLSVLCRHRSLAPHDPRTCTRDPDAITPLVSGAIGATGAGSGAGQQP